MVEFPYFKPYIKGGNYKNAYEIYNKGLCLPSSTLNADDDIYRITKTIRDLL